MGENFDADHNTTSIPSTGIFNITAEQFFCSLVKEADVRCISSTQFARLPLLELCPSGDCWTDCQDLSRLYAPLPAGITFANESFYGTAPSVTFWNLCNGLANVLVQFRAEFLPRAISFASSLSYLIAPRRTFVASLEQRLPAGVTPVVKPETVMTVHPNVSDKLLDG